MSRYQLTEAYGELYNARLTEESFYDNLRFVDYLQQEQIEEVMESLIWEFMDYGDTLEEAADTLYTVFNDDQVLTESLEIIWEETRLPLSPKEIGAKYGKGQPTRLPPSAKEIAARFGGNTSTSTGATRLPASPKEIAARNSQGQPTRLPASPKEIAARHGITQSSSAARGRRASRSQMIGAALRSAAGTVSDAMKGIKKKIANKFSNAKNADQKKAEAGLSRVARVGRGISNLFKGQPKPKVTRPQYELRKNIASVNAKMAVGQPFSDAGKQAAADLRAKSAAASPAPSPSAPVAKAKPDSSQPVTARTERPSTGRRIRRHGRMVPVNTGSSKKSTTPAASAAAPSTPSKPKQSRSFGSKASQAQKAKTAEAVADAKAKMEAKEAARKQKRQQVNASFDYDLLTQYMVEDIIAEGYADTEAEALYILESMSEENLIDLAECYLAE